MEMPFYNISVKPYLYIVPRYIRVDACGGSIFQLSLRDGIVLRMELYNIYIMILYAMSDPVLYPGWTILHVVRPGHIFKSKRSS